MTCDKVAYDTHKLAMVSASRQRKKNRHKYGAYKCADCGKYHITTLTKNLRKQRLKNKYPFRYKNNQELNNVRKNKIK